MKILAEISKILTWYKAQGATTTIERLLKAKDRLAVDSFYLAEQAAEMKLEYNQAYFQRKIEVCRVKQGLINDGLAVNKADIHSIIETEGLFNAEMLREASAYKMDLLIRQVNITIRAIEQRISYMKQEKQTKTSTP
jgi:hypothetical protein